MPTRSLSRRLILGAAAGIVANTLPHDRHLVRAGQTPTNVTVGLDWYPNANHAGLFLAQARGAFTAAGLNVDLYTPSDPTAVLQTVGAGRDTFGISYQTDVLLARAAGIPVVSVAALVQQPLLGIMSLQASEITRPADLKGKTVAYPGIPSQDAFLKTMLETDGLTLADITLVNVGFDLVPAVISGRAAAVMGAYWTHETILAEQEGFPVNMMRVEDWGVPSYYELVLVAGETTVRDNPALIQAFLAGMSQGYTEAAADPEAALDALAAASPDLDRGVEAEGLALLIPAWTANGVQFGSQTAARWNDYAAWMTANGLVPDGLDIAAAHRDDLLPPPSATASATPNA